jgi:SAM-dependent methyltransferase
MRCRHCGTSKFGPFVDLGSAPPSNGYLTETALRQVEKWYPLRAVVCESCWLVQTEDVAPADEFFSPDYAYFSSVSSTWTEHARRYVEEIAGRFGLGRESRVIEVASNDGYLLQFVKARGIPCLGIEPTASTAAAARKKGLEVVESFFGSSLAAELKDAGLSADVMTANNVLAHVPDINDFVRGFATLLKPAGVVTFEFPHLEQLVRQCQFDTIYHEHFSYLSMTSVCSVLSANGLEAFDVEELPTHGGSLRVFAQRQEGTRRVVEASVSALLAREKQLGLTSISYYERFQRIAEKVKDELLAMLLDCKASGRRICGYGAAAKGNTLLNFAGVRRDLIPFVADRSTAKQGMFLPGSRIPVVDPARISDERPDLVLILPWNLRQEVVSQLQAVQSWHGKFVTAIPSLNIFEE